jgi:hypothetical protein
MNDDDSEEVLLGTQNDDGTKVHSHQQYRVICAVSARGQRLRSREAPLIGVRWLDTALAPIARHLTARRAEPVSSLTTEPQPATAAVSRIEARSGQHELC